MKIHNAAVQIGPILFTIKEVERLVNNNRTLWGHVVHHDCKIEIEADLDVQQKRQTLLHEIVHIVLYQSGQGELADNEGLVDALTYGIMQVLSSNSQILRWLVEDESWRKSLSVTQKDE